MTASPYLIICTIVCHFSLILWFERIYTVIFEFFHVKIDEKGLATHIRNPLLITDKSPELAHCTPDAEED